MKINENCFSNSSKLQTVLVHEAVSLSIRLVDKKYEKECWLLRFRNCTIHWVCGKGIVRGSGVLLGGFGDCTSVHRVSLNVLEFDVVTLFAVAERVVLTGSNLSHNVARI